MYTLKFENEKYYLLRPDGSPVLTILGQPLTFYSEEYARIALDARNTKVTKKVKSSVKGVVDNRHRNWRRRSN